MEIRWLGEVEFMRTTAVQSPFPRGKSGVSLRAVLSNAPEQAIRASGTSSSRVVNSKIPYTLTLSLPLPVVRNQDLDHTIKPRHWTRPFTPHFRPLIEGGSWSKRLSLRGKLGAS